jgi:hypothetical protein
VTSGRSSGQHRDGLARTSVDARVRRALIIFGHDDLGTGRQGSASRHLRCGEVIHDLLVEARTVLGVPALHVAHVASFLDRRPSTLRRAQGERAGVDACGCDRYRRMHGRRFGCPPESSAPQLDTPRGLTALPGRQGEGGEEIAALNG